MRRYEGEEHPGVCSAMERTAELFIAGNIAPDMLEEETPAAESGDGGSVQQPA